MSATRRMNLLLKGVGVLALCVLCAACQHAPPEASAAAMAPAAPQPAAEAEYVLGPGDELEIRFFHNPELDQHMPIRPDGRLSLVLVGEVEAAGKSVPQLRETLVERYSAELKLPEISVVVKSFGSQKIYVGGEVAKPSVIALAPGMTVRQALSESGGVLGSARLSNVIVLRDQGSSVPQIFTVNLDYGIGREHIEPDLTLAPKDVIFVPKTYIAEVNQFVDEYIGRIVPRWLMFQLTYNVGGLKLE